MPADADPGKDDFGVHDPLLAALARKLGIRGSGDGSAATAAAAGEAPAEGADRTINLCAIGAGGQEAQEPLGCKRQVAAQHRLRECDRRGSVMLDEQSNVDQA